MTVRLQFCHLVPESTLTTAVTAMSADALDLPAKK